MGKIKIYKIFLLQFLCFLIGAVSNEIADTPLVEDNSHVLQVGVSPHYSVRIDLNTDSHLSYRGDFIPFFPQFP